MTMLRMNTETVRELARRLDLGALEMAHLAASLKASCARLSWAWRGSDAAHFRSDVNDWQRRFQAQVELLETLSVRVAREVDEWELADLQKRFGASGLALPWLRLAVLQPMWKLPDFPWIFWPWPPRYFLPWPGFPFPWLPWPILPPWFRWPRPWMPVWPWRPPVFNIPWNPIVIAYPAIALLGPALPSLVRGILGGSPAPAPRAGGAVSQQPVVGSAAPGLSSAEGASQAPAAAASQVSSEDRAARAAGLQINQFEAELQAGGDGRNANCGPTSLTMSLHALGLKVKGETGATNAGQAVDLARRSMALDPARDGVDASGARVEAEHSTYTNFQDLQNGAQAAGAHTERIPASPDSIQASLLKGEKVVVSGTFEGKSPLPWTGDRGKDNSSAPGGAGKHIIAVTDYDPVKNVFIVNDPARKMPIEVGADVLRRFMNGNAGALALGV